MSKYWYKDAVFYELHVKGFQDADNNGKGDFQGIIRRLEHLVELGINCIWILPMYPTPGRDDGYDIMDFYSINPDYGTVTDFQEFIQMAHQRNIRVIADLVVNHTSDQHPWFVDALRGPESPYFDYYVWSDTPEKYKEARIIFIDSETSNWSYCKSTGLYYWHRFFHHQPDLNYDNPKVREEMKNIIRYWLNMGLDGFRVDAPVYLFEREGTNCENLPETHAYMKEVRAMVDAEFPDRLLLAEANQWPEYLQDYFGNGDEFHMAFNFPLMPRMFMAIKQENSRPIIDIMSRLPQIPESCQWAIFLRNHDELTLEMVTDEERDYMYSAYTNDPQMRLNLGIRRRLAPLMENDRRRIELMFAILFTLPGSPVIYYGNEIGMGDNVYLGDRNGVRTPMQWNDNKNAGFSNAKPSQLYAPVIIDPEYTYHAVNVEAQRYNPHSLLNWFKQLIATRKKFDVFGNGTVRFLTPANAKVLAFLTEFAGTSMLCVFNLAATTQFVELELREFSGVTPVEILGSTAFPAIGEWPYLLTPNPYGYYIFDISRRERS